MRDVLIIRGNHFTMYMQLNHHIVNQKKKIKLYNLNKHFLNLSIRIQ